VGSVEQFQGQVRALALFSQVGGADFLPASSQERKVIIFATTRSNSEADKRRAMGFLQSRQRMNGECRSSIILTLWAISDAYPVSGHHTRTGSADRGRRPGSTGEGRAVAYILELCLPVWGMEREKAWLEA
jgi:hypothetical protein